MFSLLDAYLEPRLTRFLLFFLKVVILGLSLFTLGFAVGPLLWAPLSELYGRRIVFLLTYSILTAFNAGAAGSQNIQTLIILRFLAGAFASSSNANAGGQIVDMWSPKQRGLAMSFLILAPFIGPALGPIAGGFLGETVGWRWMEGFLAIFTAVMVLVGAFGQPETYGPVLLQKRAERLTKRFGRVYKSKLEVEKGYIDVRKLFLTALCRPWLLLVVEMIVLLLSIWIGIVYGTLYMFFSAFPIVFGIGRGWSEGFTSLAFLGVAIGMCLGVVYAIPENFRYNELVAKADSQPIPPEERLIPAMVGAPLVPIGVSIVSCTASYSSLTTLVILVCLDRLAQYLTLCTHSFRHSIRFWYGRDLSIYNELPCRWIYHLCSISTRYERFTTHAVWCSFPDVRRTHV